MSLLFAVANGQHMQSGKVLFNDHWEFYKGDLTFAEVFNTNIKKWRDIELPHDWSVEGPFDSQLASGTGYLPGGIAWYRKSFNISDWNQKNRYSIYFDGIYKNSEVWVNGHYLGKRPNGFIPIYFDLTPYLKPINNQIAVKVDHSDYADSRYYTGSGIYRNVYFLKQNQHHFSQWGVFFKTPTVNSEISMAQLEIAFENHEKKKRKIQIETNLSDNNGNIIAKAVKKVVSLPNKKNKTNLNLKIENPKLWSPLSPNLYNLRVSLLLNGRLLDTWEESVGIRKFHFDPNEGYFINGHNMLLKGVCIHQDAGALGSAVPIDVWRNRLETLKELGCNAIRMSHYPHQDYIYELCDSMGFLVIDEAFDEWQMGKNKWIEGWNVGTPGKDGYHSDFKKWGEKDLGDMVRRNRNRPSIIMWSIGNEIDYPNDPYTHPVLDEGNNPQIYGRGYQKKNPPVSELETIASTLVKVVKRFDDTRPVTAALAGVVMTNYTSYPSLLDVVGYNYQERRYEEDHKAFPNRVIYGSENGDSLEAWLAVKNNDFISSQFIWTAFDFLGEGYIWPYRSSNAGIIDLAGKPKPSFYFRKSLWNEEPMVYIAQKSTNKTNSNKPLVSAWVGTKGDNKQIVCYTNTDEVELFLNGKSLGKRKGKYIDGNDIIWNIGFEPGNLMAEASTNGVVVAKYELNTPSTVSKCVVKTDKTSFRKEGGEIIHLDIELSDEKGNRVVNDDKKVTLKLAGPAELLGLENGNISDIENYRTNYKKTYLGQLRGYIKTTATGGDIEISIITEDLPEEKIVLTEKVN